MRKLKLLGVTSVALLVLAAASAAGAAGSGLELKAGGQDLPVGSRVGVEINWELGDCWTNEYGWGKLAVNGGEEDRITRVRESEAGSLCTIGWETPEQDHLTGSVHEVDLTSAGQVTVREAVRLYDYESGRLCVYTFGKLTGTFRTSGVLEAGGTAVGHIYKLASSPSGCARTVSTPWWLVSVEPEPGNNQPTEAELVG